MSREIDRTTAEHEVAIVEDVFEMERERAALDALLREAGYTDGTLLERVERVLEQLTPRAPSTYAPSTAYDRLAEQDRQIAEGIISTYRDPNWRSR